MSDRDRPPYPEPNSAGGVGHTPMAGNPHLPPATPYTKDELRVLKECGRESFYYRCAPLAVIFAGTSQFLTMKGILTPHPRFGALFKNMSAVLAAYIVGKISYQKPCIEKLLKLENSPLADQLRKGKKGTSLMQEMSMGSSYSEQAPETDFENPSTTTRAADLKEDYNSSMDLDPSLNLQIKGLDESLRPSLDIDTTKRKETDVQAPSYTSYDEMRLRNRDQHQQRLAQQQQPKPPQQSTSVNPLDTPTVQRSPQSSTGSYGQRQTGRPKTNQYGDIIED